MSRAYKPSVILLLSTPELLRRSTAKNPLLRMGFTIVEMAIVLAVIGVLVGVAILRVETVRTRAKMALMKNDLANYALNEEITSQRGNGYVDVSVAQAAGFRFSTGVYTVTSSATAASWFLKVGVKGTNNTCEAGASSLAQTNIPILCRDGDGRVIDGGSPADAPQVRFQVTPPAVQPGEAMTVDASASTGVAPLAITIDFGDGTATAGPTAVHAYMQSGSYSLQVSAVDGQGRQASGVRIITVDQPGLLANFDARPTPVTVGTPVTFLSTSRAASAGGTLNLAWDFGDGATSTADTVVHAYSAAGHYTVALTASDGMGGSSVATRSVVVTQGTSRLTARMSLAPDPPRAGEAVTFDASGSVSPAGSFGARWDFGDGATNSGITSGHTYANPGVYTAQLVVQDVGGQVDTLRQAVRVDSSGQVSRRPVARLVLTPDSAATHDVVGADASGSRDPMGGTPTGLVAWGDGSVDTGLAATHVYATSGQYIVTLIVTGSAGADTATKPITITGTNRPPVLALAVSSASPAAGVPVTVSTSGTTDPDGDAVTTSVNFGDGTLKAGPTATHAYASGAYTMVVTATDAHGATDVSSVQINVAPAPGAPTAYATVSNPPVRAGEDVRLDASASTDPAAGGLTYAWDYGDFTTGTGRITDHSFTAGNASVTVTVTDVLARTSSMTLSFPVEVAGGSDTPPVAVFSLLPDTAAPGGGVVADARESSDVDGSVQGYSWSVGGAPLSDVNAVVGFVAPGASTTVALTVTDDRGVSSSTTRLLTIQASTAVSTVAAAFSARGDASGVVEADASASVGRGGIVRYHWDLSDFRAFDTQSPHLVTSATGGSTLSIRLTVQDASGDSASVSHDVSITSVATNPVAIIDPPSLAAGRVGVVHGGSSYDPEGGALTYQWRFSDGTASDGPDATWNAQAGLVTITLTVQTPDGRAATRQITVSVGAAPTARMSLGVPAGGRDWTAVTGSTLALSGVASSDPLGRGLWYRWILPTGTVSTGQVPALTTTAPGPGNIVIGLIVVDVNGVADTVTHPLAIIAGSGVLARMDVLPGDTVHQGEVVHFDASASTPNNPGYTALTYAWDFGDFSTGSGRIVTHTYPASGNVAVALTVTEIATSNTDSYTQTVTVLPLAARPVAAIKTLANGGGTGYASCDTPSEWCDVLARERAAAPSTPWPSPRVGQMIVLDASPSQTLGRNVSDPLTATWTFGDGRVYVGLITEARIQSAGTMPVRLVVRDPSSGLADTLSFSVNSVAAPQVGVTAVASAQTGSNVTVQAAGSGNIVRYDWSVRSPGGVVTTISGSQSPTIRLTTSGAWTVTATAVDDAGFSASASANIMATP